MDLRAVRRLSGCLAAAASTIAISACGDAKIENLSQGISRDSALTILAGDAGGGDSLANVYKQETYLLNGRTTNVLFYHRGGIKQEADSSVTPSSLTPVVISDGKVTGWGWTYYDSLAKANNIPVQPR
jgi:hypothetical protein